MRTANGLLTPVQRLFLAAFAQLPDQAQFYLAGGTALAEYYFGHRLSFDLDLFTAEGSLILPLSYQIEALGPQYGLGITVVRRFASYVEFAVSADGELLKVDLAQDSPFRLESLVLAVGGTAVPVRTETTLHYRFTPVPFAPRLGPHTEHV